MHRPAQTTKTCHASFPLIVSSHHIPILCCHGPSTVRGEHSCRDSRPLGRYTHYQASFISWHSTSRAMWQLSATFANSQSCKKREILSPDPCNPMTIVNRCEFSQTVRETFSAPLAVAYYDVLYKAVSIFLLVCQQLHRIDSWPDRYFHLFVRQEACLAASFSIVFLSTDRAPPLVAPFSPRNPQDVVFQGVESLSYLSALCQASWLCPRTVSFRLLEFKNDATSNESCSHETLIHDSSIAKHSCLHFMIRFNSSLSLSSLLALHVP